MSLAFLAQPNFKNGFQVLMFVWRMLLPLSHLETLTIIVLEVGFIFLLDFYFIMFVCACVFVHMYVHRVHAWYLKSSEEGIGSLGTGLMGGLEPLCGSW